MATYYSTNYANSLLGAFRGIPFSYTNMYLALMLNPSAFSEMNNVEYNRQPITLEMGSGTLTNANEIRFDPSTTVWGTAGGVGVAASLTGPILLAADISPFLNVQAERQVVFDVGQITFAT